MADNLLSDSHSPSGSKDGEFNDDDDDGCGKLETADVFYDTMVLDSLENEIVETQFENVCFDTEVVADDDDDGDDRLVNMKDLKAKPEPALCVFDTEIVLDSEDEGICRTNAENFRKREGQSPSLDADSTDKQFGPGKEGCSFTLDGNDHEIGRLEYVDDSQEPEESSLDALCFVDNFLTFNNVETSQGVEERTSAGKKSPLISSAKGAQRLAKIINRASPVKEMGNFEWFECYLPQEDDSSCKSMIASEFGDFQRKSDKRHQNLLNKGQRSLRNNHGEKREFADLHRDIIASCHSHSSFMDKDSKVSIATEQESEKNVINGSSKELHKLVQTEPTWENFEASDTARDIPELFDVGIGTQIAAEAMEALFYGLPAGCKTGDSCEGLVDTLSDLPEGETKRRTHLNQHSIQKLAASDLGEVAKESIRRKRSARIYSKEVSGSSWKCNYQELNLTMKPKSYNSKESKVDESMSRNNIKNCEIKKCETSVSPSIPNEQTLLRKELSQDEPVSHQTMNCEGEATMKRTNDQPDKPRVVANNVKKGSMLTYNRKRKRVVPDPLKLLSGKRKCSKLHSNSSAEALDGKLSEQCQITPQEAAPASFKTLGGWNCPKGKRTRPRVSTYSSGWINMYASFNSVGTEERDLHFVRSQKRSEDDKITSNNFYMKEQMCTALLQSSLKGNSDGSVSRQNSMEVTCVVTNSDSAITISAWDLDRANTVQTGKLDFVDTTVSTPIINGLKNHSFGKSLRKSTEPSGTECKTTVSRTRSVNESSLNNMPYVYHRRPSNKNLPKQSLLKELTRLGVPESISNFTQKGFRTRKEVAYVRVLFSQHLDDAVIKQQIKISARLGISITSCSMDATHFIADKFVRTRNMLEAIALGKPVVTHLWLDSCGQASCLLDEKTYILQDFKREKEIGFSMPVSLARAMQYPLLKDKRVCVTQNIKPSKEIITSLVKAAGGEVLEISQELAAKDETMTDDLLILSCEQDLALCAPLLSKGAAVYSSELLLNGIVIQNLEYERHQLFTHLVKEKGKISEKNKHSRR